MVDVDEWFQTGLLKDADDLQSVLGRDCIDEKRFSPNRVAGERSIHENGWPIIEAGGYKAPQCSQRAAPRGHHERDLVCVEVCDHVEAARMNRQIRCPERPVEVRDQRFNSHQAQDTGVAHVSVD